MNKIIRKIDEEIANAVSLVKICDDERNVHYNLGRRDMAGRIKELLLSEQKEIETNGERN